MKKLISLLLVLVLTFSLSVPAFAADAYEADYSVPIIKIRGNGGSLYNADGTQIWPLQLDATTEEIAEMVAGVIFPHFFNGILFDEWDAYYDAFYEAVLPIFDDMALDGNGNPQNGSGISEADRQTNEARRYQDTKNWYGDGKYHAESYTYWYDWRLTPYDVIDDLHDYITCIMETTGSDQVSIDGLCLGTAYVWAYLEKYGDLGHIKNVLFDVGISEYTAAADVFCGRVELDADALQRFANEYVDPDATEISDLMETGLFVNEVILTSIDLLNQTGVIDSGIDLFDKLYQKIYEGLVPKLAIASVGTTASYWACMTAEDYVTARAFVFGDENSEMYQNYEGFIQKIDNYYEKVLCHKDDIVEKCQAAGVHFGALAKYGYQYYPFVESQDELADFKSLTKYATLGATCAKVGETLSDEYIAAQEAAGLGKYISNDKQIDTSTALFKDSTWVIKNATHDNWTISQDFAHQFLWGTNVTVESLESKTDGVKYTRFMVFDEENVCPEDASEAVLLSYLKPMTDENCGVTQWENMTTEEKSLKTILLSLFKWLSAVFKFLQYTFSGLLETQ